MDLNIISLLLLSSKFENFVYYPLEKMCGQEERKKKVESERGERKEMRERREEGERERK
jgi:hypothetical protein